MDDEGNVFKRHIGEGGELEESPPKWEGDNNFYADISRTGKVTIGPENPETGPEHPLLLNVTGKIQAIEILVENPAWGDYVFDDDYKRMTFEEKRQFYNTHKHLPGIRTGEKIESNGLPIKETMEGMIVNLEETSLDVIELYDMIQTLKSEIEKLKRENEDLKMKLSE